MAAIPALPDAERRATYTPSASTGPFDVGFAIYGDSTDYGNWLEVWLDTGSGLTKLTAVSAWTLSSPSGSLGNLARPITDAQVTLVTAATGTLQIVGAQRPRRTVQLTEGRPVTAHDINRVVTEEKAIAREIWDREIRMLLVVPGDAIGPLPTLTARKANGAGTLLGFDGQTGNPYEVNIGDLPTGSISRPTPRIITTGNVTVSALDRLIVLNKSAASATAIALPPVASRSPLGLELEVYDWAGNAGVITFTADGTEKIMGDTAPWTVVSGGSVQTGGSLKLIPSVLLNGWLVR